MDSRLTYLLTLFPALPPLGEQPALLMAEALALLRQQGGADLEQLASLLEAEPLLREALDEWVVSTPDSRVAPCALVQPLRDLFDAQRVGSDTEEAWVGSVWKAYLEMLAAAGRRLGCPLLSRWCGWEWSLRQALARRRSRSRGDRGALEAGPAPRDDPGIEPALELWEAARSRSVDLGPLEAALEAEVALDRARLAYLEEQSPRYSFSLDELAAYLLRLRLLERHRRRDPQRGRALLEEVAAL